jgi:hypothetical protein
MFDFVKRDINDECVVFTRLVGASTSIVKFFTILPWMAFYAFALWVFDATPFAFVFIAFGLCLQG